jgi:general secretion pathway protein E
MTIDKRGNYASMGLDMKTIELTGEKQFEQLKNQFIERLKSQGYEVEQGATMRGRSGAEHSFDILAHRDNGFAAYTVAIDTLASDNEEIGLGQVFGFDDKCYDCGIRDKVLIALPRLDSVATRFAQGQRVKVLEEESLKAFLASSPPTKRAEERLSSIPKTRSELVQSLTKLGYKVEENNTVLGRSGAKYTFDILASFDDGLITQKIGIDNTTSDELSLSQISLFDTKAYDAGIQEKVLLVAGELAPEAKQFAQQQRIRIIQVGTREAKTPPLQSAVEELLSTEGEAKPFKQKAVPEVLQLIPEAMARRFNAVPVAIKDGALQVAMANPADIFALEALALQSRMRIEPIAASEKEVREAIDFSYKGFGQIEEQVSRISTGAEEVDTTDLIEATADAPVASALRLIIEEASKARASDIHIEPEEDKLRIRYRIDGALQDVMSLPPKIHLPLTSRIKIMADMNIADHLRPQDGQFSVQFAGRPIDIRVATCPTVRGETTVLRLLDKSLAIIDLPQLGFSPESLAKYENMLKVPFGMILISGPTGAGKTTTLYASINKLDRVSRNIITIEDPVEYRFLSMNQIQVNPKAGLIFASGLRSILRLDPDVVLVGEIRDADTARIAIQAGLTGHLVLSSIHANDAVGVVFRLLDLGIEPFMVSSALIGVVAQRMVRRVCSNCSTEKESPVMEQVAYTKETGEKLTKFSYGAGCELCSYTGYRGRTGIFEILPLSDTIRMQILKGAGTSEVRAQAIEEGMVPLFKDGMLKVKAGITTPSEVLRNAYFIE